MKRQFSSRAPLRWALVGAFGALATAAAVAQVAPAASGPLVVEPPEFLPLARVAVPDMNKLGLLDKTGPGANNATWKKITNPGNQTRIQALGKALFWDMQVGGDGIQACASCHFHAGADHRITNQLNPGQKGNDLVADVAALNAKLGKVHFSGSAVVTPGGNVGGGGAQVTLPNAGFRVSQPAVTAAGATADALNGATTYTPNLVSSTGKAAPGVDINDVVGSQGIRSGQYEGLGNLRSNRATLDATTPGFNHPFPNNAAGIPDTVRQVPPRNSPSVLNAVYNARNFWDGRADMFFNGVNPLGSLDPSAMVKAFPTTAPAVGGAMANERLDIPFSSLASQAVGPIGSTVEQIFDGRSHRALGKVLTRRGAIPLKGQRIASTDSLLGNATGLTTAANQRGLSVSYSALIRQVFDQRFWGGVDPADGQVKEACLNNSGNFVGFVNATTGACPTGGVYTLMQWNFPLFFGLSVAAYESTLTTGDTIADLLEGGKATGQAIFGAGATRKVVVVDNKPMAQCAVEMTNLIAGATVANGITPTAQQIADGETACASHYAKFIPVGAYTGSQSPNALFPLPANTSISGCANPGGQPNAANCVNRPSATAATQAMINIGRGLGRFGAGAWNCALCHGGSETTLATVGGTTGWGAPVLPPEIDPLTGLPEPVEQPVLVEKMLSFTGNALKAYDAGFYNIGVRPSAEDLGQGVALNGVPLSYAKILQVLAAGPNATQAVVNAGNAPLETADRARTLAVGTRLTNGSLFIPTSPTDLTPRPFNLTQFVACDPDLAIPDPVTGATIPCDPTVRANEMTVRNGAFKTPGLRNVKFTGPYMHNGSKMNLRQVVDFYMSAGHFNITNAENLSPAMRVITDDPVDQANIIEFMETGLTDWRVAYQKAPFDHPELCLTHGHDDNTGVSMMSALPAVGAAGSTLPIPTFEEMLEQGEANATGVTTPGASGPWTGKRANLMRDGCSVPGVSDSTTGLGRSRIDVPPTTTVPTGTSTQ